MLIWTNPNNIITSKESCLLYLISVTDASGQSYSYVGKTKRGSSRFGEYTNNIERIFQGLPRRTTPGQEKYRPVHFALAKAREQGWQYTCYPLEVVDADSLIAAEQSRIKELGCRLNGGKSWAVEDFQKLSIADVLRSC